MTMSSLHLRSACLATSCSRPLCSKLVRLADMRSKRFSCAHFSKLHLAKKRRVCTQRATAPRCKMTCPVSPVVPPPPALVSATNNQHAQFAQLPASLPCHSCLLPPCPAYPCPSTVGLALLPLTFHRPNPLSSQQTGQRPYTMIKVSSLTNRAKRNLFRIVSFRLSS